VVGKHFADLQAFGTLRNFIEHQRGVTVVRWAEPTPEALTLFRELVEAITAPEPLLPRFADDLQIFAPDAPINEALAYMLANDYSQVVVSLSGNYPLLSVEGVARWLQSQAAQDLVSISETTVRLVTTHEPDWTLLRMNQKATVEEARRALLRPEGKSSPRVFAILISASGRANENPLGIVTPWDQL